jgi:predicted PurR-regulated permease PerM
MTRDYNSDPSLLPARSERIEIVKIAAWLVVGAVAIAALYVGRGVLIPLAIAFLIGFALSPIVTWLTRCGLPRVLAVIVVMMSLGLVIVALGFLVASQVRTLSAELPVYQSTIREKIQGLGDSLREPGVLDGALETVDTVQSEVADKLAADAKTPRAQRVEVMEPPISPFKTAMAWLAPAVEPLARTGIVLIFSFLVLLDRGDLRDRLIRLLGGNIHRATDAMEDAGKRISKYLWMQLVVNVSYAIPMACGLWLIGVPGWLLWGTLAALMRFVPYVGPILSAAFPLTLAFAVDPGWGMLLWTLGLIVALEIISNNIVEPLLYGSSTGLSAMSLIAAATFWTALWGPVGLILSTPLTVCLLVVGRNHPQLRFLDTLLGSTPVLDIPTRIYQRLIANDPEEAVEIIDEAIGAGQVADFYNDHGIEVLRRVSDDYLDAARAEHRLRIANGMDVLLDNLRDEYPAALDVSEPRVVCIGGKWEIDSIACEMLAHALALDGIPAAQRREGIVTARHVSNLDLDGIEVICLSYFSREPAAAIKSFCRRLRQRWPDRKIVLALWNAPEDLLELATIRALGADEVVTSIHEAVRRIHRIVAPEEARQVQMATIPPDDARRVAALLATRVLDGHAREDLDGLAKRAADVFNVKYALISALDAQHEFIVGQSMDMPGSLPRNRADMIMMERDAAICNHVVADGERLVVNDTQRDPRFAEHPVMALWGARFYAGAPLKTAHGHVLGALCLFDTAPRKFADAELELLDSLAADVVSIITGDDVVEPERDDQDTSATVGQQVPQ